MQCSSCSTITLEPSLICPNCGAPLPGGGFLTSIMRVEQLIRLTRYDEAGPEMVKAEAQLKRTALSPEARRIAEARLLTDRARVLFLKAQYKLAEPLAQQAIALLGDIPALALLRANALIVLANIANYQDNLVQARQYADRALVNAEQAGEPFMLGTVLNGVANTTRAEGDTDTALQLYQRALTYAEQAGALSLVASISSNIATIYGLRGEMRTGLNFIFKALKLAEESGDELRINFITINLGVTYVNLGELDTAATYLQKAAHFLASHHNSSQYVHAFSNLAELALVRGDYAEAYDFALDITNGDNDDYRSHVLCYAIQVHSAVALAQLDKAYQALDAMEEERTLRPTSSANYYYYLVLTAPAAIKIAEHDWAAAEAIFNSALSQADAHGDVYSQAQLRMMYAEALLTNQTGTAAQARQLLEQASDIFAHMGATQNVQRAKLQLAALPTT